MDFRQLEVKPPVPVFCKKKLKINKKSKRYTVHRSAALLGAS